MFFVKNIVMDNKILNILLYVSSFIPLYFLIITKELIEIANGNLTFNVTNTIMILLNLTLIIIGGLGVLYYLKKVEFETIEIIEMKNITRDDFLPYFPLFVLFALAFELEFVSMAVVYALILIMLGVVYVKNQMFYINPFLNIIGFSTFEVKYKNEKGEILQRKMFSRKTAQRGKTMSNGLVFK